MSDYLISDYPILTKDSGDFIGSTSYTVQATQYENNIKIEHILEGQSFISELIKRRDADFSVLLLYKDHDIREYHSSKYSELDIGVTIKFTQHIPIKFSNAPEIMPYIFISNYKELIVDDKSGLTDFWKQGDKLYIPSYARIAIHDKLKFTSGDIQHLIQLIHKKEFNSGTMSVNVKDTAEETERPVQLLCATDVFDELKKVTQDTLYKPKNATDTVRAAIITQALCAVYARMQHRCQNENYETSGMLRAHLEQLQEKTKQNWEMDDNFEPSLAATKMQPYTIKTMKVLDNGLDND